MKTVIVGLPCYDFYNSNIQVDSIIRLEHDIGNKYSETAVKATYYNLPKDTRFMLGHIRKKDSEKVLNLINSSGRAICARVLDVGYREIQIELEDEWLKIKDGMEKSFDETPNQDFYFGTNEFIQYDSFEQEVNQTTNLKKENNMINKLISTNKVVAGNAAYMEAGRIATNQLAKVAASKAPLMVRGYVETPVGKVVIANLAAVVAAQYRPNDAKLAKLTNAMMQNAYMELIRTLDVEGMINEFLDKADVKAALDKVTEIQT